MFDRKQLAIALMGLPAGETLSPGDGDRRRILRATNIDREDSLLARRTRQGAGAFRWLTSITLAKSGQSTS
jgi:hypothetical protein